MKNAFEIYGLRQHKIRLNKNVDFTQVNINTMTPKIKNIIYWALVSLVAFLIIGSAISKFIADEAMIQKSKLFEAHYSKKDTCPTQLLFTL